MTKLDGSDNTRAKAEAMRQEMQRRESRIRMIIIGVVATLLVFTVATVAWVIVDAKKDSVRNTVATVEAGTTQTFQIGADGVGTQREGVPTIQEFFSYSCHACADIDAALHDDLLARVNAGEINLELTPVAVVDMKWMPVATDAAVVVYREAPEHFLDFHHAMLTYFKTQFDAQDPTVIQDTANSEKQVRQIAAEVGVPDAVIAQFTTANGDVVASANRDAWAALTVEGRETLGTPEFIANGKKLAIEGSDPAEAVASLVNQATGR